MPATTSNLPKRFYREVAAVAAPGGHGIALDGRIARTPARHPLVVAGKAVADMLVAEWDAQVEVIDPARMPATRIVNAALDGVAADPEPVAADIAAYAGTDLVCYRAGEPARLVAAQAAAWDPILVWMRDTHGARFMLSEGIAHVTQPPKALAAVEALVAPFVLKPVALAALHVLTTLSGSALIALTVAYDIVQPSEGWAAAHVDETFQEGQWGVDDEAAARRVAREADFLAAASLVRAGR